MENHDSNHGVKLHGRHTCENLLPLADKDSQKLQEWRIKKRKCESKPRHKIKTGHQEGKFPHKNELQKKSGHVKLQRKNNCMKNTLTVNMRRPELVDDKDGYPIDDITTRLSSARTQLSEENCKTLVTSNVKDLVREPDKKTRINKPTSEPDTEESVHGFKKFLNRINTSKIMRRNTRKERTDVSSHAPSAARNHAPSAATKQTSPVARKRRFCILNERDKNSLRAQLSIWFPCICHKPTLRALQDALIRVKTSVFRELRKLEIIDFNKHITESKDQRSLFRKENLHERSSKYQSIYFITSMVPECQKQLSSLSFDNTRSFPLTSMRDIRGNYVNELKSVNSKMNTTNEPELCPFTGNERHWRHSLMYLERDKLQMSTQCDISTNVKDHASVRPFTTIETGNSYYVPEWFQSMLQREVIINIHPTCPGELTRASSEMTQFMGCQRRLQLGHLFHSSDFSTGDGRLVISIREQEVTSQSVVDEPVSTNTQTTISRPHVLQKDVIFEQGTHEGKRGPEILMPLQYNDLTSEPNRSGDGCSQTNNINSVECFHGSFRQNRVSTISNHGRNKSRKLPLNTGNRQDFLSQEHSQSSFADYLQPELRNDVLHERPCDKKRSCDKKQSCDKKPSCDNKQFCGNKQSYGNKQSCGNKDSYPNQSPLSIEESGNTCLSMSSSICSATSREINSKDVSKTAMNFLPASKLGMRNMAKRRTDRKHMSLENIIPEINKKGRNSKVSFKGKFMNNVDTNLSRNIQKEDLCWPHNKSISVYRQRSASCGHDKWGHLSGGIRQERRWVRELFRNVPTSDVPDEEVNAGIFETVAASTQEQTNTLVNNGITCVVKYTNVRTNACPETNKITDNNTFKTGQETLFDKMNKSNSSVHGIQGVFECSQAIVVDDVMDTQELCMASNPESKFDHPVLTRLDNNGETYVGNDVAAVDNVTDPQTLCMVTDTESKLDQVALIMPGENMVSSNASEAVGVGNAVDSQTVCTPCRTESNLDQPIAINVDKDVESSAVNELILIDDVVESQELCMKTSTELKLDQAIFSELSDSVDSNTINEIKESKFPHYNGIIHFNLDDKLNLEQSQTERDTCASYFSSDNEYYFNKSTSVTDRKTLQTYLDKHVKMSESDPPVIPVQDLHGLHNKDKESHLTDMLLRILKDESQSKKPAAVFDETNLPQDKTGSTYAASMSAFRLSSRESLIDFIKEQWRSCSTSATDQFMYEQQTQLHRDSRSSLCDISQRTSSTLCSEKISFSYRDVEGENHQLPHSVHQEQSYETMCSERRENYLKICRTLENYYMSSSQDDFNSISSLSMENPQTRDRAFVNSHREINMSKIPGDTLLSAVKTDGLPSRSEMPIRTNVPLTVSHKRYHQPDYNRVNYFSESTRTSTNAESNLATSSLLCNFEVKELSEIKMIPEVVSDLAGYDTTMLQQTKSNQTSSSVICTDSTNQTVLLNSEDAVSSSLALTNDETLWLTNKLTSWLSTDTNKPREVFRILTALDQLLEQYFRSIEELQNRLEHCCTAVSAYDKRRKSTQKRENKLKTSRKTRQKKQILSDSAFNLFQDLDYGRFNSGITRDGKYMEKVKRREAVKARAHNCSVNNRQDTPPDSIPSDVDLIEPPAKSYSKNRQGISEPVSSKDLQLGDELNQEPDATISNGAKSLNQATFVSPDENASDSPVEDVIVSPAEKIPTSRRSSIGSNNQKRVTRKPPSIQRLEPNTANVGTSELPKYSSRLSLSSKYSGIQQAPTEPSTSRYNKQTQASDQTAIDYFTRDVETSALQNQLTGSQRKMYTSNYDTDSNYRPLFLHDDSVRRVKITDIQESYKLKKSEQQHVRQPVNSYRHMSPDYGDPEWTVGSSTTPDIRSNGRSALSTEPTRKYYTANTEPRDYYSGRVMPREQPERREFAEKANKFVPTFNSQPRIPDYCLNQTRGLSQPIDLPTTPPRRAPVPNVYQELEKNNKKQDSEPCRLSDAQKWFRDLCERVNTNSKSNGVDSQHPRHTHEDKACDGNLRIDARICVTPTICCTGDDCQQNRHNAFSVRDYRSSPSKEHGNHFRSTEVDNRLLDPSKNYNDVALLENSRKHDFNSRGRPEGFRDYIYPQVNQVEATVEDKNGTSTEAALGKLQRLRQAERLSKANVGVQFELNDPTELRLQTPRPVFTLSAVKSTKECASVSIQTCACISKPNGTCLCGYISVNEAIWPNETNELLASNPERHTKQTVNFKSVFIQTCDDVNDEHRMKRNPSQNYKNMAREMRSKQCSPIQIKYRNKKCQIGRCVQSKNECTGTGASLSNGLPCQTVSTHCQHYDRKTEKHGATTRTKCVQTCCVSETRNSQCPSREEKVICCKCKQKLDEVMAKQFETPDVSSEVVTDSFENDNDKECQCDAFQHNTMPRLDPAARDRNILPYTKYQTKHPHVQEYASKSGQESGVFAGQVNEDCSDDDEWVHGKEQQPTFRYAASHAGRPPHYTTGSGNACAISQELTDQLSGIIQNSKLLQQQALQLRNKCKYLEGQGWSSINQNRHDALSARRFLKCSNILRGHNFKKKPDKLMDKNSNANTEFDQEFDQGNRIKYHNNLDCSKCFLGIQSTTDRNIDLRRNSESYYRKFIRHHLGVTSKLYSKDYIPRKEENMNLNWNAKPRKSLVDLNRDASNQVCMYTHPQNEKYFINDPSEEAYQYLNVHFPYISRSPPSKDNANVAVDMHARCYNCREFVYNRDYVKQKQLRGIHSDSRRAPGITTMASGSSICLEEQNLRHVEFDRNINLPVQLSKHDERNTKSQTRAQNKEETADASHNVETIYTMDETPRLHHDIYSVCNDVSCSCHNGPGNSFSQEDARLQMSPMNMSCSSCALKENYWQLAYKIGNLSGIRQPAIHSNDHDVSLLTRQRQRKSSGEDGGRLLKRAPAVTRDLTKVPSITGAHKTTHSVGTMVSFINLQQPLQENVSLLGDQKIASSLPMYDSICSYSQNISDASLSFLRSSHGVSPKASVSQPCCYSRCPRIRDTPAESLRVTKKKSEHQYQNNDNILNACVTSKHQEAIIKLQDTAERSPEESASGVSLISIKTVPNAVSGITVLKDTCLNTTSADIVDISRYKSESGAALQPLLKSDHSQMLNSDTLRRQRHDELQMWRKHQRSIPLSITNCESESWPVADYVHVQRGKCLNVPEVTHLSKLTHNTNVLDSQDSNHGIENLPLDSTLSECETTGREPKQRKDRKCSQAILHPSSRNKRKEIVTCKRPLPLGKQGTSCIYVNDSKIKPTSSKCGGTILPERGSVIYIEKVVLPSPLNVTPRPPHSFQKQQAGLGEFRQIALNGGLKQFEVNMPSSEDTEERLDMPGESGNKQVVTWWNSPEFFKERRIRKDIAKHATATSKLLPCTAVDTQDPSIGSKKSRSKRFSSPRLGVRGNNPTAIDSQLEKSRINPALPEKSSLGTVNPCNTLTSRRVCSYKTNKHINNKWRTCFLGCAEVVQASHDMVFIEGAYIRTLPSLQNHDDLLAYTHHTNKVELDRSECTDTAPKVVQFRMILSRNAGSGDSVNFNGTYSRQLVTSDSYFNWEFIF